jgi:hypothetical protein
MNDPQPCQVSEVRSEASWKGSFSMIIKLASLLWFALHIVSAVWRGVSLQTPLVVSLMGAVAAALGGGLFVANLLLVTLARGYRRTHVILCLMFVLGWIVSLWMTDVHIRKRHQWFFREGISRYEEMAQRIVHDKTLLASHPAELDKRLRREYGASVATNADGSVTVWFHGSEASPRHGYIYHSGAPLTVKPGDPQGWFVHLTNGWYEY